jgi:hypothetical protein
MSSPQVAFAGVLSASTIFAPAGPCKGFALLQAPAGGGAVNVTVAVTKSGGSASNMIVSAPEAPDISHWPPFVDTVQLQNGDTVVMTGATVICHAFMIS